MPDQYTLERIENWVSDFVQGERSREFTGGAREHAGPILTTLLAGACDVRGVGPAEVEQADLNAAFLGQVAALALPDSVRQAVPDLAGAFLAALQEEGRLAGGRSLGMAVRALRPSFRQAAGGKGTPERRPGPKLGLNDPCPCGSGRKFKKCCRI
jgi:SEC-C motif-containing protein